MKKLYVIAVLAIGGVLIFRGATKHHIDGSNRLATMGTGKVEIGFRKIRYSEGDRYIEFGFDYTGEGQVVVYIPSAERWARGMPDWAKARRDEILPDVKQACARMKPIYEEY